MLKIGITERAFELQTQVRTQMRLLLLERLKTKKRSYIMNQCKNCIHANVVVDDNISKADIVNNNICDITPRGKISVQCTYPHDKTIALAESIECTAYEEFQKTLDSTLSPVL